jgi:serine/threonine protein kinase
VPDNFEKEKYALKVINKKRLHEPLVRQIMEEIRIHRLLNECPNVIKLFKIFECENYLYFLIEYQKGGTLS